MCSATLALLLLAQVGPQPIGPAAKRPPAVMVKPGEKPADVKITAVATPLDAVNLAWADIQTLPDAVRPFQWYVWIPDGDKEKARTVSVVFNMAVSRASTIIHPTVVGGGYLVRWDTRQLLPKDKDFKEFLALREQKLAPIEPYFTVHEIEKTTVEVKPYKAADGKTYSFKNAEKITIGPAPHLFAQGVLPTAAPITLLSNATKTTVPIVRYEWITRIAMTTLDDGLYYEFVGIKPATEDSKRTDFAEFLFRFFATDEPTIADRRGDNRAVTLSRVTGKWRRIDAFYGRTSRPEESIPLVTVTRDLAEGDDKDADKHPLRNLLVFKDAAREVIGFKTNGMQIFALFDGEGNLQRAAPDTVVRDNRVPDPYTSQLQPGISCVRCHGPERGYQPINNFVTRMLKPNGLNVFDDIASDEGVKDTIDRLVAMYSGGDLLKALRRGRDDYEDAIFLATGFLAAAGDDAEPLGITDSSKAIADVFTTYSYTRVTAQTALRELGFNVQEAQALRALNQILPPIPKDALGISKESPLLGALKVGLPILRSDWETEYTDAAVRVKLIREWQAAQEAAAAQAEAEAAANKEGDEPDD